MLVTTKSTMRQIWWTENEMMIRMMKKKKMGLQYFYSPSDSHGCSHGGSFIRCMIQMVSRIQNGSVGFSWSCFSPPGKSFTKHSSSNISKPWRNGACMWCRRNDPCVSKFDSFYNRLQVTKDNMPSSSEVNCILGQYSSPSILTMPTLLHTYQP